jgi:hypothetical protein
VISVISSSADASGMLFREPGIPHARFEPHPSRSAYSLLNVCRKPDLVFFDPAGGEVLRVRRSSRIPANFTILVREAVVGHIERRSPLRTRYLIRIGTRTWDFAMPLFSVTFRGSSDGGSSLWVWVGPRKQHWSILLQQPADDSIPLLGALSFIHREWWCYS